MSCLLLSWILILLFPGIVSYLTLWLKQEELRKAERKNRDEFRKLMEADVALGTLTAKTHWRDYCMKVTKIIHFCFGKNIYG